MTRQEFRLKNRNCPALKCAPECAQDLKNMFDAHCDHNDGALHHKLFIPFLKDTVLPPLLNLLQAAQLALTRPPSFLRPRMRALDYYSCSLQPLTPPPPPTIPPSTLGSLLALLLFIFYLFLRYTLLHILMTDHTNRCHTTPTAPLTGRPGGLLSEIVQGGWWEGTHTHTHIRQVLSWSITYSLSHQVICRLHFWEKKTTTTMNSWAWICCLHDG